MEACIPSRSATPDCSKRCRPYQTTYRREFNLKRSPSIDEGAPFSQQFLIGRPFQLTDPVGDSIYAVDFTEKKNVQRKPVFRSNTNRANRPHPHKQFPFWPRRTESLCNLPSEETRQALRNQLDSTYKEDFIGTSQGFDLSLAYDRTRPYWRDRAKYTLDSEYRTRFQSHPKSAFHMGGRYSHSCRDPADAIVPQTLPVWKKRSLQSVYIHEISQKTPSEYYMKEFVDSLNGPMN